MPPEQLKLGIPYLSQRDNNILPSSTCNMTSLAMALKYYNIPQKTNAEQFEDELTQYCLDTNIDVTSVDGIKRVAEDYGCTDKVNMEAKLSDIDNSLYSSHPVILHGYWTQSGHITCLNGIEKNYYFVHDPWGNLDLSSWTYFTPIGRDVVYQRRSLAAIASAYSFTQAKELYRSQTFDYENVFNMWLHEIIKK